MRKEQPKDFPIADFWKNGFAGPFELDIPIPQINQTANYLAEKMQQKKDHPIYGRYANRDWHLVKPDVLTLFQEEGMIHRVEKLLGKDLLLWRTVVFNKEPHEGTIGWHQEWGAFNGEELGNDRPALRYEGTADCWDLTVWIALCDMTMDMAPIRFAKGSNHQRFPIEMVPLRESEFYVDPFVEVTSVAEIIQRALNNTLIVDIDTSKIFEATALSDDDLDLAIVKKRVMDYFETAKGAVTVGFDAMEHEVISQEIKAGQYWIFTERVMHGSGINTSDKSRLAINGRITRGDTLVYPGRLQHDFIDGSNLNISNHQTILLAGKNLVAENEIAEQNCKMVNKVL